MATASKIQIQKVTETINEMYMAGNVIYDGAEFCGSFDCELGDGFSASMGWICDGCTATIGHLEAYDETIEDDIIFDTEAVKAITDEIEGISTQVLRDALYERELQKTIEGFYC